MFESREKFTNWANMSKNLPERKKISTVWSNFFLSPSPPCYNGEKVSSLSFSKKVNSSKGTHKCNCQYYLASTLVLLFQAVIESETFRKIQVKETIF